MANRTLDVSNLITPDTIASTVANRFEEWNMYRQSWTEEKKELRNYVYATDTRTTSNSKLPWANSTTTPKLTQIYDNLKANYYASLFPNRQWLEYEGDSREDDAAHKRETVKYFMLNKTANSGFVNTVADELLDDWILTGNCFATIDYQTDRVRHDNGDNTYGYIGPKLVRISPFDIMFDITASSFAKTPKIIRSIKTLGEVANMVAEGKDEYKAVNDKMMANRAQVGSATQVTKSDGFIADGFSSLEQYYQSGYVEVLTFYGDMYDSYDNSIQHNRIIEVVDRAFVISNKGNPSWLPTTVYHSGWRSRPDNLMAMGPLDNLVGMQYRIDHLENLRADVFDQIALPMLKIKGDVRDFDYEPGGRIILGDEGDVTSLVPESSALQADFQIQNLENKMEELAGAPRNAMGIRTPGEKTAFEVDALANAANRIFTHKIGKFEREFLEPVLNGMLESSRRNMNTSELVRVFDEPTGITRFREVTREDINGNGKIKARGASHFEERNQRVQNINNLMQIKMADPSVGMHLSGKIIAKMLAEEIGEDELFRENVGVMEQADMQKASLDAEADINEDLEDKAELGL
jgi:hypothetical protein